MNPRQNLLVAALATVFVIAACGDSDATGTARSGDEAAPAGQLDGRQFWSVSVIEGDADRSLVAGTRIELRFDGGTIGASAGCNSIGGSYDIDADGVLVVTELAMTEMGCDPLRHGQDDFVVGLLTASPSIELSGDVLRLTTAEVDVEFVDRAVADPDRPIMGTRWIATGFISGETATSMAVDEPAWIMFSDQSSMSGFDGCTDFALSVELADGSTGGPVEGDGEIQFGERDAPAGDPVRCDRSVSYRETFNQIFTTNAAVYTIDGASLVILNLDGAGVTFRADEG